MNLATLQCTPHTVRERPAASELPALMAQLPGWQIEGQTLSKTYHFADYHHTMAFVNALAWIAHQQDHHPDLSVHYNRVHVTWNTHDANGLTMNDFICAARCQALQAETA